MDLNFGLLSLNEKKKNCSYDVVPPELLIRILKPLPVPQRMKLRAVSTRWNGIIVDTLKDETQLAIREYYPFSRRQNDNELMVKSRFINKQLISKLIRLMPAIKDLKIHTEIMSQLFVLTPLISIYNLTSLSLSNEYQGPGFIHLTSQRQADLILFVDAINDAAELTHLRLQLVLPNHQNTPILNDLIQNLSPTLARLGELNLIYPVSDAFPKSTAFHVDLLSDKCTKLVVANESISGLAKAQCATSLTKFHFDFRSREFDILCDRFQSLEDLKIAVFSVRFKTFGTITLQSQDQKCPLVSMKTNSYLSSNPLGTTARISKPAGPSEPTH